MKIKTPQSCFLLLPFLLVYPTPASPKLQIKMNEGKSVRKDIYKLKRSKEKKKKKETP